jgi:hypothetical protein
MVSKILITLDVSHDFNFCAILCVGLIWFQVYSEKKVKDKATFIALSIFPYHKLASWSFSFIEAFKP